MNQKKPNLKVIEGGKVDPVEIPERVDFPCGACGAPCVMFPRNKPIAVQHALPACKRWKQVPNKVTTEQFLIEAGAHLHVPGSIKN
jgi:hypothetical protein